MNLIQSSKLAVNVESHCRTPACAIDHESHIKRLTNAAICAKSDAAEKMMVLATVKALAWHVVDSNG